MKVRALKFYPDGQLGRQIIAGEEYEVPEERAIFLASKELIEILDKVEKRTKEVEMVEETEKPKKTKKK